MPGKEDIQPAGIIHRPADSLRFRPFPPVEVDPCAALDRSADVVRDYQPRKRGAIR